MPSNAAIFADSKNVEYFSFTVTEQIYASKNPVLVAYVMTWDAAGWPVINFDSPLVKPGAPPASKDTTAVVGPALPITKTEAVTNLTDK